MRHVTAAALLSLGPAVLLAVAALGVTGRVTGLDAALLVWCRGQSGDHGPLIAVSRAVTMLGGNPILSTAAAIGIGYRAVRRCWSRCGCLVCAAAGGATIISVIKAVEDRPRPMVVAHLADVQTTSFPSGHAMDSAFVYGSLVIAATVSAGEGRRLRLTSVGAILLAFAIGTSRIILGVHWPTDVAAGWALGFGWTAIFTRFYARAVGLEANTSSRRNVRG